MAGHDCGRCVSQAGCHGSCARAPDGLAARLAAAWVNGWRLCFHEPGFTPRRHAQPRLPGLG